MLILMIVSLPTLSSSLSLSLFLSFSLSLSCVFSVLFLQLFVDIDDCISSHPVFLSPITGSYEHKRDTMIGKKNKENFTRFCTWCEDGNFDEEGVLYHVEVVVIVIVVVVLLLLPLPLALFLVFRFVVILLSRSVSVFFSFSLSSRHSSPLISNYWCCYHALCLFFSLSLYPSLSDCLRSSLSRALSLCLSLSLSVYLCCLSLYPPSPLLSILSTPHFPLSLSLSPSLSYLYRNTTNFNMSLGKHRRLTKEKKVAKCVGESTKQVFLTLYSSFFFCLSHSVSLSLSHTHTLSVFLQLFSHTVLLLSSTFLVLCRLLFHPVFLFSFTLFFPFS